MCRTLNTRHKRTRNGVHACENSLRPTDSNEKKKRSGVGVWWKHIKTYCANAVAWSASAATSSFRQLSYNIGIVCKHIPYQSHKQWSMRESRPLSTASMLRRELWDRHVCARCVRKVGDSRRVSDSVYVRVYCVYSVTSISCQRWSSKEKLLGKQ